VKAFFTKQEVLASQGLISMKLLIISNWPLLTCNTI